MNGTPHPDEIVQDEEQHYVNAAPAPVATCVVGPVNTRELPAAGYPGYKTESGVTSTLGVRVLSMEPRRQGALIVALSQDIWISSSQAGAQAGAGGAMRWPALVPYVVRHMHEVWVCAVASTTDVSVETVNWSE
jgi:hypothetical protein